MFKGKKSKKIIPIVIFFGVFFSLPLIVGALEVDYPTISGYKPSAESDLTQYLKYVFDFGIFVGFFAVVLSLIIAGVFYLISPASPNARAMAKDRLSGAFSGLLILALLYLIITTINPQLAIFKMDKLEEIPPPPDPGKQPGVYFYKDSTCPEDEKANPYTSDIKDIGPDLRNKVNEIDIVQGSDAYMAIIFDNINFWGKCQYINPNSKCNGVDRFTASASILKAEFSPVGDGIYLYRKSNFDKEGGFYKIPVSDIKGGYIESLDKLKFTDNSKRSRDNPEGCTVPEEERDCSKWNNKNECIEKQCPTLAGENITSMELKGNYYVLLVYFSPGDTPAGPWTLCQGFPTLDDVNKTGPVQIKWKSIRNDSGKIPNYIIALPIKR
ncbi:MAG: hypothetical protein Q8Q48_02875 [Candidatus Staskawiczbacteria bacterium]|nr:hypothetical protein [Candidatus Staskawiczbacteria bacterium]